MILTPGQLTLPQLRQIAREPVTLELDPASFAAIDAGARAVADIAAKGEPAYGINTGFGRLASTHIPHDQLELLQRNLVLSHAVGVGEPMAAPVVRLMIALKLSSLGRGHSGIRREVMNALVTLFNADVLPLEDYLAEARVIIDQIVDQSPNGLEVLRGNSSYIYDGNWKMQMENGCDGYHVSTVHWNYAATMGRRKEDGTQAVDANSWSKSVAGVYGFEHGHILLWTNTMNPEVRPIYRHRDEVKARVGEAKAEFIVNQTRNLCLYPNVFLMDQFSTQIRVVRPISVDKTEVTIFCFAPKGESATERATRIRQYEDFFNVSGMGTADDLEEFRACQAGYAGRTALWNDLSRGAPLWVDGPDENANKMGLKPLISGARSEDEGLFVCQHEYWARVMRDALKQERQQEEAQS